MVALVLCYNSMAPRTYKMTSVLVLFVIFRGLITCCKVGLHRFSLAALVVYPVILRYALLHRGYTQ